MATTKLSTDVIDLSGNTEALTIPSGTTGPDTTDTTGTCNYPTTATALYQLQSNDDDTCGNYNGTGETNITYTSGKFGDSATFSGNGKIIIPSFPSFSSTGFTISLWIKTTDTLANAYILILNQVNYALFNINRNSGSAFSYYNGSWQTGSITVRDGNWHNIVVAISPNSPSALQVLYVDGVEDIRTTNSYGFTGSNSYNNIGTNNGTNPYTGQIAQLRIFPSVLTQADVTKLYNETNVTSTGARPTSPTEGLLRDNITTGALEFYNGSLWQQISGTLVPGFDPLSNFNTLIYQGDGGTKSVTGVGFAPGLTVIKGMNAGSGGSGRPGWYDTVRGGGYRAYSNVTSGYPTQSSYGVTVFGTDGFTVHDTASSGDYNVNGAAGGSYSGTPPDYVSWNWKAGGTAVTNNDGTVASQVSANVDAGFSIITNTSPSGAYTWGHGLSKAPEFWIHKATNYSYGWETMYPNTFGQSAGSITISDWNRIFLNTTAGKTTNAYYSATDTVLSNAGWGSVNNFVTYCWHSVADYSKIGSYVGNGSSTGPIVTTGFKPAWLMIKDTGNSGGGWYIYDNKRDTSNPNSNYLQFNNDSAQTTGGSPVKDINFFNTSFQIANSANGWNYSGNTYIYMAFSE